MKLIQRLLIGLVLSTAMVLAWLPGARASNITISANPSSGNIDWFPAIPQYDNFASTLTVTGAVSGTPTWSAAPAPGSPSCASYIQVTFGNVHAWNTTATFNDHQGFAYSGGCGPTGPVTINLS